MIFMELFKKLAKVMISKRTMPNFGLLLLWTICLTACSGKGNMDISNAKPLQTSPVTGNGPNGTVTPSQTTYAPLFSYPPGAVVAHQAGAVIDQTGTSLNNDYDGDGLTNDQETASSMWVADYPRVEASVSTPVTMTIDIQQTQTGTTDSITTNIGSSDYQNNRDFGTENVHRNEMGVRTTQIQNSYSGSNSTSSSSNTSSGSGFNVNAGNTGNGSGASQVAEVPLFGINAGGSSSSSSGSSYSNSSSFSKTVTLFPDVPQVNDLDSDGWSVKASTAATNARQFRSDLAGRNIAINQIGPTAGHVRAALYIKNFSVNMPVHLSNILCTLMFETPTGDLVPMQSFQLKNDDFSPFTLDLYGDSQFGPYVIDLPNLNTIEVQNAIQLGYSPKIYIVNFDMSHVPNSNYQAALPGVIGNNVKIVEENAKGRTALVKIKGPGMREMFRIAAFEFDQVTDPCAPNSAGNFRPGVTLENALIRLNCARANGQLDGVGINFTAGNFIFDLSDVLPNLPTDKSVLVHGIQSLAGLQSNLPCAATEVKTGTDGVQRTVCRVKKISDLTTADLQNYGMWIVFANGKYYSNSDYLKANGNYVQYDASNPISEKVLRGITSIIWAGDNYDLVYVSLQEMIALQRQYGTNPLETNVALNLSTKWDNSLTGSLDVKYQPDKFSVFLGQVANGDQIQLTFKLNSTAQLQYTFGTVAAMQDGSKQYTNPSYNLNNLSTRFNYTDALKFEVNFGTGGNRSDWYDLLDTARLMPCGGAGGGAPNIGIDYVNQTFTICFNPPNTGYNFVSGSTPALMNMYLRPKLLDEYRNTIWPEMLSNVRKFKGQLNIDAPTGASSIQFSNVIGTIDIGDTFIIGTDPTVYTVGATVADTANPQLINITLANSGTLNLSHSQFEVIRANSTPLPNSLVTVNITQNYFSAWNNYLSGLNSFPGNSASTVSSCTGACIFFTGFSGQQSGLFGQTWLPTLSFNQANLDWIGVDLFGNDVYDYNYVDASKYSTFLNSNFANLISVPVQQGQPVSSEKLTMNIVRTEKLPRATGSDFNIASLNFSSINSTRLRAYAYNGKVLYLWFNADASASIMACEQDIATGLMGIPIVVMQNASSQYAAAQYNDKVYILSGVPGPIVTQYAQQLSGVQINSANLNPAIIGSLYIAGGSEYIGRPNLAISSDGSTAIIAYVSSGFNFSLNTISLLAGSYTLGVPVSVPDLTQERLMAFDGNTGVILYRASPNGINFGIYAVPFSLGNQGLTLSGAVVQVASYDSTIVRGQILRLAYQNGKAFIAWDVTDNSNNGAKSGEYTVVDFSNPTNPQISSPQVFASPGSLYLLRDIVNFSGKGLIVWDGNGTQVVPGFYFYARNVSSIDLSGNLPQQNFVLDSQPRYVPFEQNNDAQAVCSGSTCKFVWDNMQPVANPSNPSAIVMTSSINYRELDIVGNTMGSVLRMDQAGVGIAPIVITNIGVPGISEIVSWYVQNPTFFNSNILGVRSNYVNIGPKYGLNNFFTAPLLERKYTVSAKLL